MRAEAMPAGVLSSVRTEADDPADDPQTLTWEAEGHLATVSEGDQRTSYIYDADGNRLIRRDATGTTAYLPGGTELHLSTNGAKTCTRYYNHAGATIAVRTAGGLTWLVPDHHNTAQISVDPTTLDATYRRMTPFGQTRGSTPTTWPGQRGFVDGTVDKSTGLTHLGAREYDPDVGRFISIDPVIDQDDPQQMHGYAYASNNPTSASDPDGLAVALDNEGNYHVPSTKKKYYKRAQQVQKRYNTWKKAQADGRKRLARIARDKEILASGVALNGNLVLAPSSDELNAALDEAEADMCMLKVGCSRDSWTVGEEFWEQYAYAYICNKNPAWCGYNGPPPVTEVMYPPAENGMGSGIVKKLLPSALRGGSNARAPVYVYFGLDKSGKAVYVGITNNVARRAAEHARSGKGFARLQSLAKPVTRGEARAIEQALIKRNPHFQNKVNSISPNHEYQRRAVEWGEGWLRANGVG
ncbi:MAG: RHS repeat-associated core domain-containing protein [Micromonosporaceae bacterium]